MKYREKRAHYRKGLTGQPCSLVLLLRHCFQTLIPAINVQGQVSDCIERGSQGRELLSWFKLHLLESVV